MRDITKTGVWITRRLEDETLRPWLVRLVPRSIETYHLTLMTVVWTVLAVAGFWFARLDIRWLWLTSAVILCQYATDLADGAVGRARSTGLVRWGHYMDHLLDFIFFTVLAASYLLVLPSPFAWAIGIMAFVQASFMASMFLSHANTGALPVSFAGIGPTEVRIGYIVINIALIMGAADILEPLLPYAAGAAAVALVVHILKVQSMLWTLDRREK